MSETGNGAVMERSGRWGEDFPPCLSRPWRVVTCSGWAARVDSTVMILSYKRSVSI